VSLLQVVVHEEGVARGWRGWTVGSPNNLRSFFTTRQACGQTFGGTGTGSTLGSSTWGFDHGSLDTYEPLVRQCAGRVLYANFVTGGNSSPDYNRLSCCNHCADNEGAGVGVMYDVNCCSPGVPPDCVNGPNSARPVVDATFYTPGSTWGRIAGTDNQCNGGCPWSSSSGLQYDYAIYVA